MINLSDILLMYVTIILVAHVFFKERLQHTSTLKKKRPLRYIRPTGGPKPVLEYKTKD